MRYEYKVVPAPVKGTKAKGVKAPEGRFAIALEHVLNDMGTDGWEFQRAETLPSEERAGLTGSVTVWRNVLVFRRALQPAEAVALLESPERASPVAGLGAAGLMMTDAPAATDATADVPAAQDAVPDADWHAPKPTVLDDAATHSSDNGVEATQDVKRPMGFLQARAERLRADTGSDQS